MYGQEDFSIMDKPVLDEAEASNLQSEIGSDTDNPEQYSDASDVEEDEDMAQKRSASLCLAQVRSLN